MRFNYISEQEARKLCNLCSNLKKEFIEYIYENKYSKRGNKTYQIINNSRGVIYQPIENIELVNPVVYNITRYECVNNIVLEYVKENFEWRIVNDNTMNLAELDTEIFTIGGLPNSGPRIIQLITILDAYKRLINGPHSKNALIEINGRITDPAIQFIEKFIGQFGAPNVVNTISEVRQIQNMEGAICTTKEIYKQMNTKEYISRVDCIYRSTNYESMNVYAKTQIESPSTFMATKEATYLVSKIYSWDIGNNTILKVILQKAAPPSHYSMLKQYSQQVSGDNWLDIADNNEIVIEMRYLPSQVDIENAIKLIHRDTIYKSALRELSIIYDKVYGVKSIKRLVSNPIGLDRRVYRGIYPPVGMLASEKADGKHAIIYINRDTKYIVTGDEYYELSQSPDNRDEVRLLSNENGDINMECIFVAEGELIKLGDEYKLLLFDVVCFNSYSLLQQPTGRRITYLPKMLVVVNKSIGEFRLVFSNNEVTASTSMKLSVEVKEWIDLQPPLQEKFEGIYHKKREYDTDGIIMMTSDTDYGQTKIYKWKPIEATTIDFLARKCPSEVANKPPNYSVNGLTCYWLFSGITPELRNRLKLRRITKYETLFGPSKDKEPELFPIQFSPADDPQAYIYFGPEEYNGEKLDGKIVELARVPGLTNNPDGMVWELVKVRTDKQREVQQGVSYGNFYKIAELTWDAIHNPLLFEHLYNFSNDSYFKNDREDKYKLLANYNSAIKSILIDQLLKRSKWVIDLASGKGQDIFRYGQANVEYLTCIEIDKDALNLLNDRKLSIETKGNKAPPRVPNITIINSDVTDSSNILNKLAYIKKHRELYKENPSAVVCNFAIHYFIERFGDFAQLLNTLLKNSTNGIFMFTALDGAAVFEKLRNKKFEDSYIIKENGEVKYQIQRRFKLDKFVDKGQHIGVLLPFSNGELYDEQLVNFKYVNNVLKTYGFTMTHGGPFAWEKFSESFPNASKPFIYNELSEADKEYLSLYSYGVWVKGKK